MTAPKTLYRYRRKYWREIDDTQWVRDDDVKAIADSIEHHPDCWFCEPNGTMQDCDCDNGKYIRALLALGGEE